MLSFQHSHSRRDNLHLGASVLVALSEVSSFCGKGLAHRTLFFGCIKIIIIRTAPSNLLWFYYYYYYFPSRVNSHTHTAAITTTAALVPCVLSSLLSLSRAPRHAPCRVWVRVLLVCFSCTCHFYILAACRSIYRWPAGRSSAIA